MKERVKEIVRDSKTRAQQFFSPGHDDTAGRFAGERCRFG